MRYQFFSRVAAALAVLAVMLGVTSAVQAQSPQQTGVQRAQVFNFPAGATVFPEGVAKDPNSNFFYVGATADGTIYRGDVRQPNRGLTVFLPGGADGRTTAIGLKVDNRGYLWVSGGATGNIWMYDTRNGRLLSQFNNGISNTFINDVTITPDGAAYFTDSRTPIIYRVAPNAQGIFTFEYWRDLNGTAIQYAPGFNLNGIANTADGAYLVVIKSDTGQLFRIATASKDVAEIPLAGGDKLTAGDGILLDGQTLHVARNSLNLIVQVRLASDFASGQQVGSFTDPSFGYTTTIAQAGDRLLVVNSQFNNRGPGLQPTQPFTVSSVPLPSAR
ncbi:MAG: superoxide dismutase [Roseiflexaceae bacterium]|nr:superoxide dismutase [Roseiflexaceae bacterium]